MTTLYLFNPFVEAGGTRDTVLSVFGQWWGVTAVLAGTVTATITETDVVAGAKTTTLTVDDDTWV